MTVLKLYKYPDKVLRQKCSKVEKVDDELRKFLDDMLETMYVDGGCGLAAPQIGVTKRIIVLDDKSAEEDISLRQPMYLVNPEIVWTSEEKVIYNEGCLSLPEQRAEVERFEKVKVRYLDYNGNPQEIVAGELLSIILQHEIDHLDGVLYIDHISRLKRSRLITKLNKYYTEHQKQD